MKKQEKIENPRETTACRPEGETPGDASLESAGRAAPGREPPRGDAEPESALRDNPALADKLKRLFKDIDNGPDDGPEADQAASGGQGDRVQGRVIGDFRVLREIGRGGMATVYEAEQISLKRRVALKVLSPHLSVSGRAIEKFHREAEAGSRQRHEGIVAIHTVGEDRGIHYIAQELVEGGATLADMLEVHRRRGEFPQGYFREAAGLISEVAGALGHAHASGVIHRDVKPSNILLAEDGRPKVTDFGLARVEDALALSRSGDFAGTPYYMSPEQAMSRRSGIDLRTDVFSLGVTLYETLTLERPFDGKTSHEVLKKILLHEPRNPRRVNARVPVDLSVICLKAMEKHPDRRYQTMEDFRGDLCRFLLGEPIRARPAGRLRKSLNWIRRHKPASLAMGATLSAVLAIATLLFVLSAQRRSDRLLAEQRFVSVGDALQWPDLFMQGNTWRWCIENDPLDPSGYLLHAIYDLESGRLQEAQDSLVLCMERCDGRGEVQLEKDALYLSGLVRYALAERMEDPGEKNGLLERARSDLSRSWPFDPVSPDHLVWRTKERYTLDGKTPRPELGDLRLNREHFLVQLNLGLALFDTLYQGGGIRDFERSIHHFEAVLRKRPHHLTALTCLGRAYYFLARFYDYMDLLDRAAAFLEQAIEGAGDRPYQMIPTTLGEVLLLKGDTRGAGRYIERALGLLKGRDTNAHNIFGGLGKLYAYQGRTEEALRNYDLALDHQPTDPTLHMSLAEFYMLDDPGQALEHARLALERSMGKLKIKRQTRLAPAYLACARAHLQLGEAAEAVEYLLHIENNTRPSARDMSLACILIAVFPGERLPPDMRQLLVSVARNLVNAVRLQVRDRPLPPVYLSASGAVALLEGNAGEAIEHLNRAIEERRRWPEDTRSYHWTEDTRDLFFLAMAYQRRAGAFPDAGADGKAALQCFERAESSLGKHPFPVEGADIFLRARSQAREFLGIPD